MEIAPVLEKMASLVLLMLVGFVCAKLHVTGPEFNARVNPVVMNVLLVATVLNSALSAQSAPSGAVLLQYVGGSTAMLLLCAAISWCLPALLRVRREDAGVLRLLVTFSNNAFVGLPVVQAVFGTEAVFYASLSNIPFNVLLYTAGVAQLRGDGMHFHWRQLVNAPLVATLLAVLLILTHPTVPAVLTDTISTLGASTTPISMLVIGTSLGGIPLQRAFGDWRVYAASLVRLIVCPVATWLLLRLFTSDQMLLGIPVLLAACPAAMVITVLCLRAGKDEAFSSEVIFMSTVLSAATIPLIIWLLF